MRESCQSERTIVQKLAWLPLSPDGLREELARRGRMIKDYEIWNIDTKLAAAFDEVNREAKRHQTPMYDQVEFSKSLRDRQFTKRFMHLGPTLENMDHFLDPKLERPSATYLRNFKAAKCLLTYMLRKVGKLKPISLEKAEDCLKVWGNKSGSNGFGGRGSKEQNIDYIFATVKLLEDKIRSGEKFEDIFIPAVVFHRSQISNYIDEEANKYTGDVIKYKDRMVLGVDGATVTLEGRYAKPLYQALFTLWYNYSGGDDPDKMRSKIGTASKGAFHWYQLDFSKFDQSIQSWLIGEAFDVVKTFFPKECERELSWIAYNFINTTVLMPGGRIVRKHRGVPSGSFFTQAIGSMCNALMLLTYLCSLQEGSVSDKVRRVKGVLQITGGDELAMFLLGDDSLMFTRMKLDLKDMASYLWKVFGATISAEKSVTDEKQQFPHYLKRDWRYDGEWRNPLELVVALCHPEYFRTYEGYGPWHIIYGLYLTYRAAFPRCITEDWILTRMENDGGIDALQALETRDLPGPLRGFGDKSLAQKYVYAKALLRSRAA